MTWTPLAHGRVASRHLTPLRSAQSGVYLTRRHSGMCGVASASHDAAPTCAEWRALKTTPLRKVRSGVLVTQTPLGDMRSGVGHDKRQAGRPEWRPKWCFGPSAYRGWPIVSISLCIGTTSSISYCHHNHFNTPVYSVLRLDYFLRVSRPPPPSFLSSSST